MYLYTSGIFFFGRGVHINSNEEQRWGSEFDKNISYIYSLSMKTIPIHILIIIQHLLVTQSHIYMIKIQNKPTNINFTGFIVFTISFSKWLLFSVHVIEILSKHGNGMIFMNSFHCFSKWKTNPELQICLGLGTCTEPV
jgi:hypothetical protein